MTEIEVGDWARSVAWYQAVLGFRVVLTDERGAFALLAVGGDERSGRVALKGAAGGSDSSRAAVRLVFEVPDLAGMLAHLLEQGVPTDGPRQSAEGYAEIRLADPDGTPIRIFAWTAPPAAATG